MAQANFPPEEIATLVCNGQAYSNWKTVRVDFEVGRAWAEFQFTAVEAIEVYNSQVSVMSPQIQPGASVQILLAGRVIIGAGDSSGGLTCSVEIRQSAFTPTEHAVMLFGRDHTKNCVDCSAHFAEGQGQFINQTFSQIAPVILATVCVGFSAPHGDNGYVYPYFSVGPGETAFAAVERLMRYQPGMRAQSDGAGTLVCDFVGIGGAAGAEFVEGKNILQSTATIDITKSMGLVEARAHQPPTDSNSSSDVVENQGFASDPTIDSCRYRLEMCEEPATKQGCQLRAQHEITTVGEEVIHCIVKVPGWFEQSGSNFQIWKEYGVWSPSHMLNRSLWSRKVTFELNDQDGATTTLELCTLESLNPEGIITATGPGSASPTGTGIDNGNFFGQGVSEAAYALAAGQTLPTGIGQPTGFSR